MLKSGRCNCQLDVSKLLALYPGVLDIHESLKGVFARMRDGLDKEKAAAAAAAASPAAAAPAAASS